MRYEDKPLIDNSELQRFELHVDNHIAFIEYKFKDDKLLFLIHTEVPPELEGKGVASAIVQKALQHAKDNNIKIIPRCSFVQSFLEKHPEWNEIVAPKPD
jgi:predicted GNAT family acetyltransferase